MNRKMPRTGDGPTLGESGVTIIGTRFLFQGDENVIKLIVVMVT